ncbi:MAG: helix-turn-helix transcriptional regulator [Erysipelotrichaceae bacterium]|nr:helix-turn-helix transcriptional regulator [Erysipelotrichaceae bacterium]
MAKIHIELERLMADKNISLNELSERVGITNVNLSKLKNNRVSAIRFSTLLKLCEVLGCEPGDIIRYVEEY